MMTELKYRKVPVVVEAWHVTPSGAENRREWPDWMKSHPRTATQMDWSKCPPGETHHKFGIPWISINTLEGQMRANIGDWVIKGVKGELYPCKPDIFALTYEPATRPDGGDSLREARELMNDWVEAVEGLPASKVDQPKYVRHLYELADKTRAALTSTEGKGG